MPNDYQESNFDDEVYEDEYYDEHYNEEELEDDSERIADDQENTQEEVVENEDEGLDEEEWDEEKKVHVSFACEDCDYRWDDVIIKRKGDLSAEDEYMEVVCPMCGSMNVTQI